MKITKYILAYFFSFFPGAAVPANQNVTCKNAANVWCCYEIVSGITAHGNRLALT